jgi:hypothetical protein
LTQPLRFENRSPSIEGSIVSSPLIAHLLDDQGRDPAGLLTADVRFRSPFADYEGRDTVARLFRAIPRVFEDVDVVETLAGADETRVTILHGQMAGEAADAVVFERHAADGRASDIMILVRPLPATKAVIARMGQLLEDAGR